MGAWIEIKDGSIEVRVQKLIRGEAELDQDTLDEFGDEIYLMTDYEVIDRGEFNEESVQLFREQDLLSGNPRHP